PTWAAEEVSFSKQRPLNQMESNYRQSVINGWRMFQTSFAEDSMACVNCHLNHDQMTGWAGGYPKVEVFDGTPYSVKTLHQVVLETLGMHTDLPEDRREAMAVDIAAYISWWGDGQPVRPGISRDIPPATMDLEELKSLVNEGLQIFKRSEGTGCIGCHEINKDSLKNSGASLGWSFATFPRYDVNAQRVVTLDTFLTSHVAKHAGIKDREQVTALAAYLADLAKGRYLQPGTLRANSLRSNKNAN
ncbi:MAG: hypothetical protein V3S63_06750, partial [bacterium]